MSAADGVRYCIPPLTFIPHLKILPTLWPIDALTFLAEDWLTEDGSVLSARRSLLLSANETVPGLAGVRRLTCNGPGQLNSNALLAIGTVVNVQVERCSAFLWWNDGVRVSGYAIQRLATVRAGKQSGCSHSDVGSPVLSRLVLATVVVGAGVGSVLMAFQSHRQAPLEHYCSTQHQMLSSTA